MTSINLSKSSRKKHHKFNYPVVKQARQIGNVASQVVIALIYLFLAEVGLETDSTWSKVVHPIPRHVQATQHIRFANAQQVLAAH